MLVLRTFKMKKPLTIFILSLLLASCSNSGSIASSSSLISSSSSSDSSSTSIEPSYYDSFAFIPLKDDTPIHSELVENYFKQEQYDYSKMDARINAKTDLGDNLPIKLLFNRDGYPQTLSYKVTITDLSDNKEVYKEEITKGEIDFINYKLDSEYKIMVTPVADKIGDCMPVSTNFRIPKGHFRTITVDGVNNFRDLGDGAHLKQGLIYRSATFENNTSANEDNPLSITDLGKKQISSLGLVSEIDLRKDDEKKVLDKSYLDLKYLKAPLYYGGQNILTYKNSEYNNPETIKTIFEFLGNKDNYPLNIHCVRGTDRTGCLSYLIKGLLGIEEEMLYRDFLFSNFYNIGSPVKLESVYYATNPNATSKYANVIKLTEGETLKDKIYNYLSSDKVGVSTAVLDNIINILKA